MSDCIFCKIISGDIPSTQVYSDDNFVAFRDINPSYPTHILIVPREHIESVNEITEENEHFFSKIFTTAKRIASEQDVEGSGYRLVVNSGPDSGQEVNHFHMHLLGGQRVSHL